MNTFQVVLATDGELSFVTFLYADIQWINGVIGAGIYIQVSEEVIPGSFSDARNLTTTSNVGVPGIWMYSSDIVFPPELP